jgi:hypothetical protein
MDTAMGPTVPAAVEEAIQCVEEAFARLHFTSESAAIGARMSVAQALGTLRLHARQATPEGTPFVAVAGKQE